MDDPVLLVHWEKVVGEILDRTATFPRSARFSFAARIDARCLDILECLVTARYAPRSKKVAALSQADQHLAVLRVLLRLSHRRQFITLAQLEHLSRLVEEAGQMLGGWIASIEGST